MGGFRASHDQRFAAGPRQGHSVLDPRKMLVHFSVFSVFFFVWAVDFFGEMLYNLKMNQVVHFFGEAIHGSDPEQSVESGDEGEGSAVDSESAGAGRECVSFRAGACSSDRGIPRRDPGNSGRVGKGGSSSADSEREDHQSAGQSDSASVCGDRAEHG